MKHSGFDNLTGYVFFAINIIDLSQILNGRDAPNFIFQAIH